MHEQLNSTTDYKGLIEIQANTKSALEPTINIKNENSKEGPKVKTKVMKRNAPYNRS
jgi:hypothetical protein